MAARGAPSVSATSVSAGANYSDGQTAQIQRVSVEIEEHASATRLVMRQRNGEPAMRVDLDDLRRLRDTDHVAELTVYSVKEPLARLTLENPDQIAFVKSNARYINKRDGAGNALTKIAGWGAAAIAAVLLIIFVIVPALSDRLAVLVPQESEQRLGLAARDQIRRGLSLFGSDQVLVCTDEAGQAALDKMTTRILGDTKPPLPLEVQVFDHKMQNAFALPGGYVVLFRGLIDAADTPEQVAGVLGHEIGHVVNRDPLRLAMRSSGTAGILGLILGDFTGGTVILLLTERLIAASHGQAAETAADDFAVRLMNDAVLPTSEFAKFFEQMEEKYGESTGMMSHLASHPDLSARARKTRAAGTVTGDYDPVLTAQEWDALRNMCKTLGPPLPLPSLPDDS